MCKGNFQGRLRIEHQGSDNIAVLDVLAIRRDQPEHFFADAGHPGKGLDFPLAYLGRQQHRALDDLARIANQQHPFIAPSFERHLNAFHHAQAADFLQQRFAFDFVGLGQFRGVEERLQTFEFFLVAVPGADFFARCLRLQKRPVRPLTRETY